MALWKLAVAVAFAGATLPYVSAQAIDPNLKPSKPSTDPISYVDFSLDKFERPTLNVNGKPFFFNGIQLRADKIRDVWGVSQDKIGEYYKQAAADGFTVVNTQVLWSEIQPDASFDATESTYIQGGSSASKNFASSTSSKFGYKKGSEGDKALTYIKFDFSKYRGNVDAAKVRFYVDSEALGSKAFVANLYGITNNNWKASAITWANGAPNHSGVDIAGTKDKDYFLASSSPSWDKVLGKAYYDFDVTDFVKNHSSNKISSFILQASTKDAGYAVGASVHGAKGTNPPQLVISDKQHFEWEYIDRMIGWANAAGIKLEFVWFGSDSTTVTMDSRVPYFVLRYTKLEKLNNDGSHEPITNKNTDPAYGVYWYLMDKNDLGLRALEKNAIKKLMNHVADYNKANGNKRTVIGVDVANEPSIFRFHQKSFTPWQNPKTFGALKNFASLSEFRDRTLWEFCANLANAVKESNYPVWTRSNDVRGVDARHVSYNEELRKNGGTSLDFIGLDPYSNSFTTLYKFGHTTAFDGKNYATGQNIAVIMENGGEYTNTDGLIISTLAGGGYYNVYDFMSTDGHGLYDPKSVSAKDFTATPHGPYVSAVRNTNKMLNKIAYDLSTRLPVGAGGKGLDWLNVFWNDTSVPSNVGSVKVLYEPKNTRSVGIVDKRGAREVALLSTGDAEYTLSGLRKYGISSVESGSYDGTTWKKDATVKYKSSGDDVAIDINGFQCVRIVVGKDI